MTRLEEEIRNKIVSYSATANDNSIEFYSKAAAEVAKRYIEKAFDAGRGFEYGEQFGRVPNPNPTKEQWLKENGIY
jgi:hypothetical protein